jgi:hypothetical protein
LKKERNKEGGKEKDMETYRNNQYIKIIGEEKEIIRKCKKMIIKTDRENKNIDEVEMRGDENVLICYKGRYEIGWCIEYKNINGRVKIIITDYIGIEDKWREIPEYIETIIIKGQEYKNNKDELDMIEFNSNRMDIINRKIKEEDIEKENIVGESILFWACVEGINEIETRIEGIKRETINKITKKGETAIYWASYNMMNKTIIEMIKKGIDEEIMDRTDERGYSVIFWICYKNIKLPEEIIKEIIKKSKKAINTMTTIRESAIFWACYNNMTKEAVEITRETKKEVLEMADIHGYTPLYYAMQNNNDKIKQEIIKRINEIEYK